jgi:hypothetical protein
MLYSRASAVAGEAYFYHPEPHENENAAFLKHRKHSDSVGYCTPIKGSRLSSEGILTVRATYPLHFSFLNLYVVRALA